MQTVLKASPGPRWVLLSPAPAAAGGGGRGSGPSHRPQVFKLVRSVTLARRRHSFRPGLGRASRRSTGIRIECHGSAESFLCGFFRYRRGTFVARVTSRDYITFRILLLRPIVAAPAAAGAATEGVA